MATYTQAPPEIRARLMSLAQSYHRELIEAEVTFSVLMAAAQRDEHTGEPKGPALTKAGGWPALAKVRIVSLRDRVAGIADVQILLDGDQWEEHSPERMDAILDHELEHIEVQRDDEGQIKADDCGRPKLRLKLHDWELGGFDAIVERHQEIAVELEAARRLMERPCVQQLFECMR